jgi:hypothetical protein
MVVPTGPALTRLSYGVRGQDVEVATLSGSPRPTRGPRLRGGFLSPDLSNPWVQTSSGSCTKQGTRRAGREVALPFNIAEGRELGPSAQFRDAQRPHGQGALPRKGHRVDVGGYALPAPWAQPTRARRARSGPQHVPSASAFPCRLMATVSSGGFL